MTNVNELSYLNPRWNIKTQIIQLLHYNLSKSCYIGSWRTALLNRAVEFVSIMAQPTLVRQSRLTFDRYLFSSLQYVFLRYLFYFVKNMPAATRLC